MGALKQQKSYYFIKGRSENIHLLLKGKYHCMAYLPRPRINRPHTPDFFALLFMLHSKAANES